ncbi:MAG TPA: SpoIIE family protein phosphatase [Rectinemataceae bacterium]|nr:SpoIIE family protein phosphatase [Rectinemataceae bacterium]
MTYRNARRMIEAGSTAGAALAFLVVPFIATQGNLSAGWVIFLTSAVFMGLYLGRNAIVDRLSSGVQKAVFSKPETQVILDFSARVGQAFTLPDLIEAIRDQLERRADMGAVLVRSNTWEIIYQSPSAAARDEETLETLQRNFREWSEGFCFVNEALSISNTNTGARGFFVNAKGFHVFFLTRLCGLVDMEAFRNLYGELRIYFDRVITISELFEVASLSKEWELIAETQRSFLPKSLPKVDKLDLAVSYRPLVNVSGDYYDVIAVDDKRTLFVVGDVSGKGLAAALVMGIIVNTIRVAKDKVDLAGLIRAIDRAVRDMGFDDKYTVVFLGVADTEKKTLRYINAAMADPIIITQTALGPKLRRLEPTMGLVGLVPLEDEIVVEEIPLRSDEFLLLASDGVTEVANTTGERLGETEHFERALLQYSRQGAVDFVGSITGLLYDYVGDLALKDDVTILAAKVGRLWD